MKHLCTATVSLSAIMAAILMLILSDVGRAQTTTQLAPGRQPTQRITKAFINLTGDTKLAHRLWTFLDIELDDAHVSLANTESGADIVVDGSVKEEISRQELAFGVVKLLITGGPREDMLESCASVGTSQSDELFSRSAEGIFQKLQEKYPKAVTIMIDPGSDLTRSNIFGEELSQALVDSAFKRVDNRKADLALHIDLSVKTVPIIERLVTFDVSVHARDGSLLFSSKGSGILNASLEDAAPQVCPDRFVDFDWLMYNDPVFQLARAISKQIRKSNAQVPITRGMPSD